MRTLKLGVKECAGVAHFVGCFHTKEEVFPSFFKSVLDLYSHEEMTVDLKTAYIRFFSNCFQSLGDSLIREHCERLGRINIDPVITKFRLVTLKLWDTVKEGLREEVYENWPKLKQVRQRLDNTNKKRPSDELLTSGYDKTFLPSLFSDYFKILDSVTVDNVTPDVVQYCCRFLEFVLELISQLSTRRVVHLLLEDNHLEVRSRRSALAAIQSESS